MKAYDATQQQCLFLRAELRRLAEVNPEVAAVIRRTLERVPRPARKRLTFAAA